MHLSDEDITNQASNTDNNNTTKVEKQFSSTMSDSILCCTASDESESLMGGSTESVACDSNHDIGILGEEPEESLEAGQVA